MSRPTRASAIRARETFPKRRVLKKRQASEAAIDVDAVVLAPPARVYTIHARTLSGVQFTSELSETTTTVADFKRHIFDFKGVPVDQLRLVWRGQQLNDDLLLHGDYGIPNEATVYLLFRLGGPLRHEVDGRSDMDALPVAPKDTVAVTVRWAHHVVPLRLHYAARPSEVVARVRRELRERGIPVSEQPMFCDVRAFRVGTAEHTDISLCVPTLDSIGAADGSTVEFVCAK